MKVAIYARYSSENQRQQSIEDQISACKRLALREGFELADRHIFWDEARSGSIRSRPGLDDLLKACEAKEFQAILVDDLSRLSRNNHHLLTLCAQFQYWQVELISVADGLNTKDENSKLSIQMRGIVNELYLDDLKKKTHRGQLGQKMRGYVVGENTYGYRHRPVGELKADRHGKYRPDGYKAVIDAEEAEVVRKVYGLFVAGKAVCAIAQHLNRENVATHRRLKGGWNTSTVSRLLKNAKYAGQWTWNKSRTVRDPLTGKKKKILRPESEWVARNDEDLRIIDQETWDRARARWREIDGTWPSGKGKRGMEVQTKSYVATHPPHLLAGALRCGDCGGAVVQISGKGAGYYGCHNAKKKSCANALTVPRRRLEDAVLETLRATLLVPEKIHEIFKRVEAELTKQQAHVPEELKLKLAARDKVQDKINNFVRFVADGRGSTAIANALVDAEVEEKNLEADIKALEECRKELFKAPPREWVAHRLADLKGILEQETEDSALVLRRLLGSITLLPTRPDIGRPYYRISTNLDATAIYPPGTKSSNSLQWRRERVSNGPRRRLAEFQKFFVKSDH